MVKSWKQPEYSSSDNWLKKVWYLCMMEYYLAINHGKFQSYVGKWIPLEKYNIAWNKPDSHTYMQYAVTHFVTYSDLPSIFQFLLVAKQHFLLLVLVTVA